MDYESDIDLDEIDFKDDWCSEPAETNIDTHSTIEEFETPSKTQEVVETVEVSLPTLVDIHNAIAETVHKSVLYNLETILKKVAVEQRIVYKSLEERYLKPFTLRETVIVHPKKMSVC